MRPKLMHYCIIAWNDAPPQLVVCTKVNDSPKSAVGEFVDPLTFRRDTINHDQVVAVGPKHEMLLPNYEAWFSDRMRVYKKQVAAGRL